MSTLSVLKIPRGVADPEGEFAYIVGPQSLICRLDLKRGEIQACSIQPGIPLAIQDETLIGWKPVPESPSRLHLFALVPQMDTLEVEWEQSLSLPNWVDTSTPQLDNFRLEAMARDQDLLLKWEAHSRYSGGAPPPDDVEESASRDARGSIHIDPKTGEILRQKPLDHNQITTTPGIDLPRDWRLAPYLQNEGWVSRPWSLNSGSALLVTSEDKPGLLLVQHQSSAGAASTEFLLSDDPGAVAAVTPDGKFIFVHQPAKEPLSWLVFSVADGGMIAKLPYDPATQDVSVVNDQVIFLVIEESRLARQIYLRSRDLQSGKEMWTFTLSEETAMTPPPPPP